MTRWDEFDCVDCGAHVYALNIPSSHSRDRCAQCEWVTAHATSAEHEAYLREFLDCKKDHCTATKGDRT